MTVFVGLAAAWFLAACPTSRVPSCWWKATHDGKNMWKKLRTEFKLTEGVFVNKVKKDDSF